MRPFGGRLVYGHGRLVSTAEVVCHCLLIETTQGLVLVDSGLGVNGTDDPIRWLGRNFTVLNRPVRNRAQAASRQIAQMGYAVEDVKHVVLTHLDCDHAGGIADFPHADVHVYEAELRAALSPHTRKSRRLYREVQWVHRPRWVAYPSFGGQRWFGFDAVHQLKGLPPDILFVPLAGHTAGHAGVAVANNGRWLLYAGDAYYFRGLMDPLRPHSTLILRLAEWADQTDGAERLDTQRRLRELVRDHPREVEVYCAHDAVESDRYGWKSAQHHETTDSRSARA